MPVKHKQKIQVLVSLTSRLIGFNTFTDLYCKGFIHFYSVFFFFSSWMRKGAEKELSQRQFAASDEQERRMAETNRK